MGKQNFSDVVTYFEQIRIYQHEIELHIRTQYLIRFYALLISVKLNFEITHSIGSIKVYKCDFQNEYLSQKLTTFCLRVFKGFAGLGCS